MRFFEHAGYRGVTLEVTGHDVVIDDLSIRPEGFVGPWIGQDQISSVQIGGVPLREGESPRLAGSVS
ncbi:MAG: hypothetical protein U0556_20050 [Dehalococcoidia bacterium]